MTAVISAQEFSVPTIDNKYIPLFELGQGGMGTVVLAVVRGPGGFNKLQVVKSLRPELAENPEFLTMFLDEARLSARINHANVVQTNEVGFDGNSYFLAMEFLEGQSLEAFFLRSAKAKKTLDLHVFVHIVVEACAGLQHAHELVDFDGRPLNVVHRDVSPHNIFITYDGQTKVLDFGIAKAADSSSQTRTGIIKGKVAYMAPEQFKSGSVDRRADIFALGAILWRTIAGRRLWKNMTDVEVYQHLGTGNIPSPLELNPDAPPELVAICMKALSPDVEQRYQTASDLQLALEEFLARYPEKASARVIGKQVSDLFADRRASVKAAIEARLAGGIPSMPTMSTVPQLFSSNSRDVESVPELSDALPPSQRTLPQQQHTAVANPAPSSQTALAPTSPSGSSAIVAAPKTPRVALFLTAAVLSVVAAGVIVARIRSDRARTEEQQTTSPSRTDEKTTTLSVETDPTDARVALDDRTIEHHSVVKNDGALHKLTVEAEGYVPHVQMVDLSSATMDLHVALERSKASAALSAAPTGSSKKPVIMGAPPPRPTGKGTPTTTGAAPKSPEAPPPPAPAPAPAPADKGGLDTGDPWATKKK